MKNNGHLQFSSFFWVNFLNIKDIRHQHGAATSKKEAFSLFQLLVHMISPAKTYNVLLYDIGTISIIFKNSTHHLLSFISYHSIFINLHLLIRLTILP